MKCPIELYHFFADFMVYLCGNNHKFDGCFLVLGDYFID